MNTEEQNNDLEEVKVYVRAAAVDGYTGFCPICCKEGYYNNETGNFIDGREYTPDDFFFNPGFLVILLGGVQRDTALENAALAIHASIQSLFATCGIVVHFERMRTLVELDKFVRGGNEASSTGQRSVYSHIILVGHGNENGVPFLDDEVPVRGDRLANIFACLENCEPLQII